MSKPDNTYVKDWLEVSAEDDGSPSHHDSLILHEAGLATSLYQACSQQLSRLAAVWPASSQSTQDRLRRARLARLRSKVILFGDSFDQGKLEACLNGHDILHTNVIALLYDIGNVLQRDVVVHLVDRRVSKKPDQKVGAPATTGLRELLGRAKAVLTDAEAHYEVSSASTSEDEDASDADSSERAVEAHCLDHLTAYVDLLMDLCPTLELRYNDMHQSNFQETSQRQLEHISVTPSAIPYVINVRDKFPRASQELVERLGEANWQRHERLRAIQAGGPSIELSAMCDSSSIFQPVSMFQDSALGSSMKSLSQRAMSNASRSSFVSSTTAQDKGFFKVPGLPNNASYGTPFICPYCRKQISKIKNRIDWKIHVFSDLNAYICTKGSCALNTFPSRKVWFEHETAHHLTIRSLKCQICSESFDDPEDFIKHGENQHGTALNTGSLKLAAIHGAMEMQPQPADTLACALCLQRGWSGHREYSTHVGRHLEEIALATLPPIDQEDDDEDNENGHSTGTSDNDTVEPFLPNDPKIPRHKEYPYEKLSMSGTTTDQTRPETVDSNGQPANPSEASSFTSKEPLGVTYYDRLYVHILGTSYSVPFERFTIKEGIALVAHLREMVGRGLNTDEKRIKLIYKGQHLENDSWSLSRYGVKPNSEITALKVDSIQRNDSDGLHPSGGEGVREGRHAEPSPGRVTVQQGIDIAHALRSIQNGESGPESLNHVFTLEDYIRSTWARIQASPDSYVMSELEFAVFSHYRARAEFQNNTARDALSRYWSQHEQAQVFEREDHDLSGPSSLKPSAISPKSKQPSLGEITIGSARGIICICSCNDVQEDGNMVSCASCKLWQHVDCYYSGGILPEHHLCVDCSPLKLNLDPDEARKRKLDGWAKKLGSIHWVVRKGDTF